MATTRTAMLPDGTVITFTENKTAMTPFGIVVSMNDLSAVSTFQAAWAKNINIVIGINQ